MRADFVRNDDLCPNAIAIATPPQSKLKVVNDITASLSDLSCSGNWVLVTGNRDPEAAWQLESRHGLMLLD